MTQRCSSCGTVNPPQAKFCLNCATPLEEAPQSLETRKTITALFSDVTGSTALGEQMDPESFRTVMARYFEEMKPVVERHGGTVEKFIGDAITATFGVPQVHEDDALRAIRAALEMRQVLARVNQDLMSRWGITLAARTGINSGEVIWGQPIAGHSLVLGDAMNVAARLQVAADPGDILIGETTYRLVRDAATVEALEPLVLKGKSEPVRAFRLLDVAPNVQGTSRRLDSPLVGRRQERAALAETYHRCARDSSCELALILGDPGVGKTRLALDLADSVSYEARILLGRCLSYGEGITFWPVSEIVRQVAEISDEDSPEQARAKIAALLGEDSGARHLADRVAQIIGLVDTKASRQEIFDALREFLQMLARQQPLVVVIDDVHWAEPALLDAIEYVAKTSADASIFLVCMARPEFRERHSRWADDLAPLKIELDPLSGTDSDQLVRNLLGRATVVRTNDVGFIASAQGNPLFLEQMISMLVEEGHLRLEAGRWVPAADLSDLELPPTIQVLLASRVDRLPPSERAVVEAAAVLGKEFWKDAAVALCPEDQRELIDLHLSSLINKGFVQPDTSNAYQTDAFSFRHVLVREAAYDGISKQKRAELHEKAADFIEEVAGERLPEYDEIVGYHLEQAYIHRTALGLSDAHATGLARRAAERLAEAGRRTARRGDPRAADNLLTRAVSLLPEGSQERLELLMGDLALVLYDLPGGEDRLSAVMLEFVEGAESLSDERLLAHATLMRLFLAFKGSPDAFQDVGPQMLDDLIPVFEGFEDALGLSRVYTLKFMEADARFRIAETHQYVEQAVLYADRCDVPWGWALVINQADMCLRSAMPVPEALERCDELLRQAKGIASAEAPVLAIIALLTAMRGEALEALEVLKRAEEVGADQPDPITFPFYAAGIHLLAGDLDAAQVAFEANYDQNVRQHGPLQEPYLRSWLAEIACRKGLFDQAEDHVRFSKEAAQALGHTSLVLGARWAAVLARCLADRGYLDEAVIASERAVTEIDQGDHLEAEANMRLVHAEVLGKAGQMVEALDMAKAALQRYEQKGITVMVQKARRFIDELAQDDARLSRSSGTPS